jgi:GT2 family glycosyltransferase
MSNELSDEEALRRANFRRADRRSRVYLPDAADLLARARALRELGRASAAGRDLARASEIDPTDPDVNHAFLQWGPAHGRADAAKRLLAHGLASNLQLEDAVQHLMHGGARLAYRLQYIDCARVAGWVVWGNDHDLTLQIEHKGGHRDVELAPQPQHPWFRFGRAAAFDVAAQSTIYEARLLLDGEVVTRAPNFRLDPCYASVATAAPGHRRAADHVLVIVPVFADLTATKSCLESLARQNASIEIRTVVVDDGSPDTELKTYLDWACEAFGFTLLRQTRNFGFVGAVNRGLTLNRGGDILFLNADATLPEQAIERLRRAVYSAPDIGTATPFSNNGEYTSFPVPFRANPLPTPQALAELDRIFQKSNSSKTIDLPTGVGFCLYIKRDCFEAVGPLSPLYAPGYGEDLEFCLTARLRGFRHVCAADVFVGHAGSLSFRAAKRALVKRNTLILEERFANFRGECAAFLHADPLRDARSRPEQELPPRGATRLLTIPSSEYFAAAQARTDRICREGGPETVLLLLLAGPSGRAELKTFDSNSPQSLVFEALGERGEAALADYLRAAQIDRVEILGGAEVPDEIYALLYSLNKPIDVVRADGWPLSPRPITGYGDCGADSVPTPCEQCRALSDARDETKTKLGRTLGIWRHVLNDGSRIVPLDPLAAALTPQVYGRWPRADFSEPHGSCVPRAGQTVAVLAPTPTAAVDALLKRLGREIRRAGIGADVVVFGACLNDDAVMSSSAVFVVGPVRPAEYPEMIAAYEIGFVVSPYRNSHFWVFGDQLRGLPKAYFDWSFGMAERSESDLAMDPRICDVKAARQMISWLSRSSGEASVNVASG